MELRPRMASSYMCFRHHAQPLPRHWQSLHSFGCSGSDRKGFLRQTRGWAELWRDVCRDHHGHPWHFQTEPVSWTLNHFCLFTYLNQVFLLLQNETSTRLSYLGPVIVKKHCFTAEKEFPELGSRFKASHVKSLLWWFAVVSMEAHEQFPDAAGWHFVSKCFQRIYLDFPGTCFQVFPMNNPNPTRVLKAALCAQDMILKALAYCSWNLNRAMEIFDRGGIVLTRCHAKEASRCLLNHLRSYQFLATQHGIPRVRLFNMKPKCHYLWHTAIQTREWRINPTVFHCFDEESWLGRVKAIARQCHGKTMQSRVMQRYLICLALYLEDSRRKCQEIEQQQGC